MNPYLAGCSVEHCHHDTDGAAVSVSDSLDESAVVYNQ